MYVGIVRPVSKRGEDMINPSTIASWSSDDILTLSAIVFGGGIITVMLYTYLHDYAVRFKRR
jgi:hypothetical protein